MRNSHTFAFCLVVAATVAGAQGSGLAGTIGPKPTAPVASPEITDSGVKAGSPEDIRHKVAQLMIVTLQGKNSPNSDDMHTLERYTPGGVVLTSLAQPSYAAAYIQQVRAVAEARGLPLLVGVDLYSLVLSGGDSIGHFVELPSPLSVAAADHPASIRKVATLLADHLVAMGFNMNIGPSLELTSTLPNVKGSIYRFGSDPILTASAASTIVQTLVDHNLLVMPVGFPGGGANRLERMPAVLVTPPAVLEQQDLKPYIAAIAAGAPMMHIAPTLVPLLDSADTPACLSAPVMEDLLRKKLGFKGLAVAGPMDSSDISQYTDPADAAMKSLGFGADMIYWIGPPSTAERAIDRIAQAVVSGDFPAEIVTQAYERVKKFKEDHDLLKRTTPKAKEGEKLSKKKEYADAAYEVERRAVTLVQNRNNLLPLNEERDMPIGVTGVVGVEVLHDAMVEYAKPIAQQVITTAMQAGRIHTFEIERLTRHIRGIRTVVCILTDAFPSRSQVELVQALQGQGVKVVVVLLGYPRDLDDLAVADAILLTYTDEESYGQTLRAVADVLFGLAPINIYPPVRPLETVVGREERFNVYDLIRTPSGRLPMASGPFESGTAVSYDCANNLKKVHWDFGDGSNSKNAETNHAYKTPGTYEATLTLTERSGETSSQKFNVIVK